MAYWFNPFTLGATIQSRSWLTEPIFFGGWSLAIDGKLAKKTKTSLRQSRGTFFHSPGFCAVNGFITLSNQWSNKIKLIQFLAKIFWFDFSWVSAIVFQKNTRSCSSAFSQLQRIPNNLNRVFKCWNLRTLVQAVISERHLSCCFWRFLIEKLVWKVTFDFSFFVQLQRLSPLIFDCTTKKYLTVLNTVWRWSKSICYELRTNHRCKKFSFTR